MNRDRYCSMRAFGMAAGLVAALLLAGGDSLSAPPGVTTVTPEPAKAIRAGEFAVAKAMSPGSLPTQTRDRWLAQIATAQTHSGDSLGAASTIREIDDPGDRRDVIDRTRGTSQGLPASGGGAMADFQSLMGLIETTVVPDTWEALGGNSTMAPYPQGVFVDSVGTVKLIEGSDKDRSFTGGSLDDLDVALSPDDTPTRRDWRSASPMRYVSLRRLRDEIATRRMTGVPLGDELLNLAGLSKIQYLVLAEDDIILAAPIGGIDTDRGWFVDRRSGRSTLRSDFLARCLASSFETTPFGCTIDPTATGMQAAMRVADEIRQGAIPIGQSAGRLRQALGMQRVEVFGTAGDSAVALLMVEADRHMKQLALGQQPMPEGVDSYLDVVDDFIAQGPPDGLLLRLWFTARPQSVRSDTEKRVFEIAGSAIQLSGANQRALADGARGDVAIDPRSVAFVDQFNRNWNHIRDRYPIYGSLEGLYRVAAIAHLVHRFGSESVHQPLALALASEDDYRDWTMAAPKRVESIATLHTIRNGSKRHHVLLASGGISVVPASTVKSKWTTYPTLTSQVRLSEQLPPAVNHWWWDAR